jgi:hypothetical protein
MVSLRLGLTLTTQPHQKIRFLEIFFEFLICLPLGAICKKKQLFFVKTPKNNFSDPQTKNLNKTRWKHF